LRSSLGYLLLLFIPAGVLVLLLGQFVLSFFGPLYVAHGYLPLQLLTLASAVGALNYFGDTLLNIKKLPRMYVFMNALNAVAIVALVYASAPRGLAAIALSNLVGQVITLGVYITINWPVVRALFRRSALKQTIQAPEVQ